LPVPPSPAEITCFTHFEIGVLPGTEWGTAGPAVGDFDGDGDPDVAISRRETATLYWYETRPGAEGWEWARHPASTPEDPALRKGLEDSLGAAVLDVDGDGWLDVAVNRVWFENPGTLERTPDAPWPAHPYGGGRHDVTAADIDGDGRPDLLTSDGTSVRWYDTSADLEETVVADGLELHGATAPRGFGDLDGDGDADVVVTGQWFENPGTGQGPWTPHEWPHRGVPRASYGASMRSWIVDLNGDGRQDIVYSDCDTGYGHVYWVENLGQDRWERHPLEDPPGSADTGSFHSLAVADLDRDGDLDVFAGEQEDPDTYMVKDGLQPMKPQGLEERGVVWENEGIPGSPRFTPRVIHQGRPGWHDTALVDFDGDGDLDLISKVWNTGGRPYHLDLWRNDNPGCRAAGTGRTR
ncbi:MAG: VCBS repeat-containing protein, partial [Acidobacteria bacterium]|nr:VCBS repeat-containing protein [Acidobacteriota bacterium]